MKLTTYIFVLIFGIQIGFSQTYIYQHFGVDEGLPSSEVYDTYQDKLGYIWFATDKGLSRYNGYEFENFTTKNGLPDNTILDFYPQKNGQVWCYGYHSQKLFYFEEEFNGFKSYEYNHLFKQQITTNTTIKNVLLDENGNVNISGYSLPGYIKITTKGVLTRHYDLRTVKTNRNVNLGLDRDTKAFFLLYHEYNSNENLQVIDTKNPTNSRLSYIRLSDKHSVLIDAKLGIVSRNGNITYYETEQYPIGIKRITDSTFFVGYYSNGGEIRDINGKVLETFLPNKSVSSFFKDKDGSFWFSTVDDGVFHVKNPDVKVLTEKHISSLTKDNKNKLYTGFSNGNIACINNNKIKLLHEGLSTDKAIVQFDNYSNKLFGYSDYKLFDYTTNKKCFNITANRIPEQITKPLLGSSSNAFYVLEKDSIVKTELKYKIQDVCNYNDKTFIATSKGLHIKNKDSLVDYQPLEILKSRIDDIDIETTTNTLYMATQGNGVIVFNKEDIYKITKDDGLTNNIISEIHIENDSTIWACSNTGLNRLIFKPKKGLEITTITKADGLLSNDINDIEIINDTIWLATKKGLCYFEKQFLDQKSTSKILSLNLESATANKASIKNNKLNYYENSLEFNLQAISQRYNKKIEYLYRLKEIDTTWKKTKNRTISFPNLSSGNYTFQAKASIFDKPTETTVDYKFKILPPFWKSWWFKSICTLLLTALLYLFFKIRILTYNQDVFRELIRLAIKRLKRKEQLYKFRANGEDFKIPTHEIQYVNSQGNYLDIFTGKKKYTIRCKIGDFIATTPDSLEYLRVHRSYIIRIDQVTSKGKNWVVINNQKIPVGETYLSALNKIQF